MVAEPWSSAVRPFNKRTVVATKVGGRQAQGRREPGRATASSGRSEPVEGRRPIAVAITGASGALYATRTVAALLTQGSHIELVVSDYGRRLLREAFRLSQYELPRGVDLVVIPRPEAQPTLDLVRASLRRLARKVAQKLKGRG